MDAMPLIVFIRHGESTTNTENVLTDALDGFPLTERGRGMARGAMEEVRKLAPSRIVSSPVLRAKDTAAIINEGLGLGLSLDDRLWERRMGAMNGRRGDRGMWRFESYSKPEFGSVEGWESVRARMRSFMDNAASLGGTTVAVSHGDPIAAAICEVLGLDEMAGFGVRVGHCRLSIIGFDGGYEVLGTDVPYVRPDLAVRMRRYQ